jgi:hypothetical protein
MDLLAMTDGAFSRNIRPMRLGSVPSGSVSAIRKRHRANDTTAGRSGLDPSCAKSARGALLQRMCWNSEGASKHYTKKAENGPVRDAQAIFGSYEGASMSSAAGVKAATLFHCTHHSTHPVNGQGRRVLSGWPAIAGRPARPRPRAGRHSLLWDLRRRPGRPLILSLAPSSPGTGAGSGNQRSAGAPTIHSIRLQDWDSCHRQADAVMP